MKLLVAAVFFAFAFAGCDRGGDGPVPPEGEGEGEGEGEANQIGDCAVGCIAGGGQLEADWAAGCDDPDAPCLTPTTCAACLEDALARANSCNTPGIAEPGIVCD